MSIEDSGKWELTPEKYLNEHELRELLRKADELWALGTAKKRKDWVRGAVLIWVAVFSGCRNSEICNLKVTDLHLGNAESHLVVLGKGDKQRVVHIGAQLKKVLKQYLRWKMENGELHQDAYLLRTKRSERFCPSALWRLFCKYSDKTLHSARHTHASLLYRASGNNLRAVQKQLGHSRITTTQIYADVMPDLMRDSVTAMEQLAGSIKRNSSKRPRPEALAAAQPQDPVLMQGKADFLA